MPYAVAQDNVRLYFEEAGSGTPIIFLHEFAADHTNWEPQMRYFSRGHRCIAYSARGYTPSDVPPSKEVYTYKHFYTDALAVLDHLENRQGAFRRAVDGLLFVAAGRPQRAGARAVDDARRRRLGLEPRKSRSVPQAMPGQWRAVRDDRLGRSGESDARGAEPDSVPAEGPARPRRFLCRAGAARCQGLGQHHAQLSGRPALDLHPDRCDPESADADADHLRRRGRQLHRAEPVPEEAFAGGGAGVLSEDRPRAQSGGAGAVQRDGRAVHRAGGGRQMAGARSKVDGGGDSLTVIPGRSAAMRTRNHR